MTSQQLGEAPRKRAIAWGSRGIHSSLTLEANNAKPSGIMMMLAKRTMALSAFMISELTF